MMDSADPLEGWSLPEIFSTNALATKDIYGKMARHVRNLLISFRRKLLSSKIEFDLLNMGARQLLCLVLFLVGVGVNRAALRDIGWAPFGQAILLWLVVSVATAGVVFFLG